MRERFVRLSHTMHIFAAVVFPEAGGGSIGDGDSALLLLWYPIHGGRAFVHFAYLNQIFPIV